MKFRRKAQSDAVEDDGTVDDLDDDLVEEEGTDAEDLLADGPFDSEELPPGEVERLDLGSLLIMAEPNRELRLQVDEASGTVQSVVIAGPDGALELRAFAAPRNGDLWSETRPKIAAEVAQAGGTATEREGPWGTELICEVGQRKGGTQVSRVIGINGPRWMLRCSLLGAAAVPARRREGLGGEHPQGRGAPRRPCDARGRGAARRHAPAGPTHRPARLTARVDESTMTKKKLRSTISRWANPATQDTHQLRQEYARAGKSGAISIADAPDRERVTLRGSLRTVTLRPRAGVPALEAELNDGSGVITVVWLGRRRIAGIEPGRAIEVEGRIGAYDGVRVMYNPRYQLIP